MNPDDPNAAAQRRFITNPPPGVRHVNVSLLDNPWLPIELQRESDYLRTVDIEAWDHIYGGACRTRNDAMVFGGKYVSHDFTPTDKWDGPYFGVDFGFSQDPSTMIKCWVHERVLYLEHEAYAIGVDIDKLPTLFNEVPRCREYTIRADNSRPETIAYLQQHGFPNMASVEKYAGSVEDGIAFIRQFEKVVIHPRCRHALDEFGSYAYKVDRLSGDILPDLKSGSDHIIDALRYALAPLIKQNGAGAFLTWFAGAQAADKAQAATPLSSRQNVIVRDLDIFHGNS